jgi:hypothetical protein
MRDPLIKPKKNRQRSPESIGAAAHVRQSLGQGWDLDDR